MKTIICLLLALAASADKCTDYTIVSGDTCNGIAAKFATDLAHISLFDGPCPRMIYPGQVAKVCPKSQPLPPMPVPANCTKHTVVSGDTCNNLAAQYHTDLAHVFVGNGRSCPWMIFPGEVAIICPSNTPVPPTPPAPKCDGTEYTIVAGDNCNLIASRFHTDIAHISLYGGACTWMIYPGEVACIKPTATLAASADKCTDYTIVSGDTCNGIAAKFATDLAHISLFDGPCPRMIYPGQVAKVCPKSQPLPPMPVPTGCTKHTVVSGDTCNNLAAQYHTDLAHVFVGNGRSCPWMIFPGEVAIICPSNTPVPPTPPAPKCDGTEYTIVAGDNCNLIASRFHTDIAHISLYGGACTWMIYPGEVACIKPTATLAASADKCTDYTIVSGDTCNGIAAKFATDLAHISLFDGPCPRMIYPGQVAKVCPKSQPLPPMPVPTGCTKHTVVSGDTCNNLAAQYHTDLAHVFVGNGRSCPWMIFPGEVAIICPSNTPVPPTPPAPKCDGTEYTIVAGDNCNLIASRFHTDIAHISLYGGACTWMIYPGEVACVHPASARLSVKRYLRGGN